MDALEADQIDKEYREIMAELHSFSLARRQGRTLAKGITSPVQRTPQEILLKAVAANRMGKLDPIEVATVGQFVNRGEEVPKGLQNKIDQAIDPAQPIDGSESAGQVLDAAFRAGLDPKSISELRMMLERGEPVPQRFLDAING